LCFPLIQAFGRHSIQVKYPKIPFFLMVARVTTINQLYLHVFVRACVVLREEVLYYTLLHHVPSPVSIQIVV